MDLFQGRVISQALNNAHHLNMQVYVYVGLPLFEQGSFNSIWYIHLQAGRFCEISTE